MEHIYNVVIELLKLECHYCVNISYGDAKSAFNAKLNIIFKRSIKTMIFNKKLFFLILLVYATNVFAMPKVNVTNQRNLKGFAEMRVTNQTMENLVCYVAIDGHKIYMRLGPIESSKWYTATDKRHNHTHFSTWCDYLKFHPKFQKDK